MGLDASEAKALADIEQYGCHIIHVLEDEVGPCFTYSIGIERTSHRPELIVTGLKPEIAQSIINNYSSRVQSGEVFEADTSYADFLEGFDVRFAPVSKAHYKEYFGWARWLYDGNDFRVYQLIWPSTEGVWPWDQNARPEYTWYIPLLSE